MSLGSHDFMTTSYLKQDSVSSGSAFWMCSDGNIYFDVFLLVGCSQRSKQYGDRIDIWDLPACVIYSCTLYWTLCKFFVTFKTLFLSPMLYNNV